MNRYKGIASALALALALAGCSSLGLTTTSPAQGVFAARGIFSAALDVANRYKALPACGGMVVVCSTPSVVATLQKSANAANAVLDSAETTVKDPAFAGSSVAQKALASADAAVSALTAITSQLKTN